MNRLRFYPLFMLAMWFHEMCRLYLDNVPVEIVLVSFTWTALLCLPLIYLIAGWLPDEEEEDGR